MRYRAAIAALIACLPLQAADVFLHGRVVTDDGSAPGRLVTIEKLCTDHIGSIPVASTNAKGEFTFHIIVEDVELVSFNRSCVLRAALKGYQSTTIDFSDWKAFQDPNLPPITLIKRSTNPTVDVFNNSRVPARAVNQWLKAGKAADANRWTEAERELRAAVLAAPKFAQGWYALGAVLKNEHQLDGARQAEQRAVELNPKLELAYLLLARFDIEAQDWAGARQAADTLVQLDSRHRYPEADIDQAIARFQLQDAEGAQASIEDAIRLDRRHDFPRAEYILGMILEARRQTDAAREHMRRYLALEPKAFDAAEVRSRIEHASDAAPPGEIAKAMEHVAAVLQLAPSGEAWVPGGIKALAAIAGASGDLSYQNFFTGFCRALVRENSPGLARGVPHYQDRLLEYIESVAELGRAGEHRDDQTTVTVALQGEAQRAAAARILYLLGWKLEAKEVEPGDQPADGFRQSIPAALGIDEIAMQRALEAGRSFEFAVPSENARLIGGDAWARLVKALPSYRGGIAEAFVRDLRLAKVYAGLGSMGADTAAAVVSSVGLQSLVEQYADVLARDPEAFALSQDGAVVPGNEEAWKKIAGASPHSAAGFFHALLDRDAGSLAAFLTVLEQSDAAHQKFFTATPERAQRFYDWYRDSGEPRWSLALDRERWRGELLRRLPLDSSGNVRFPGGRRAWTSETGSDEDVLLKIPALSALVPVAGIEQRRGATLDEASARLLAGHFSQWRALVPYFEEMPGLGAGEFRALESFTQAAAAFPAGRQNAVLGEWDSLMELTARAQKAGSIDAAKSARIFRAACQSLLGPDHKARADAIFREIGGVEALRLRAEQRAKFDRVLQLQQSADSLRATVYAAALSDEALLVNEDPGLVAKHRFVTDELFPTAKLVRSAQGAYLTGTFAKIDEVARRMALAPLPELSSPAKIAAAQTSDGEENVTADFRAEGRLVEVYATVTDSRGHYVDNVTPAQFSVLENGRPRPLVGFESRSAQLSLALLLDTTGSMYAALPALKAAALKLIGELRASDQIAVYGFDEKVHQLLPFSADKDAAGRAVLATRPIGETALYDALARVNLDLSARTGKKVIVVFTDGDDNASTLTAATAIQHAKAAGVPVYTIAEGAALTNPEYLKQLAEVSRATGGVSYAIRTPTEIRGVFEKISAELMHTYFFAFRPEPVESRAYQPIEVVVSGGKSLKVRARNGYYPE
ncbi:MAG TPA: VWA domain-containing protein [Bryobacteraceae bacterium]|nr:VWA domain-containing protein [Bryobacteraceae bacterium]